MEYENNGDINKKLLIKEYLNKTKPFSKDINNLKKSDTWKLQWTIAVTFISPKKTDEERVMYSNSGNINIIIFNEAVTKVNWRTFWITSS